MKRDHHPILLAVGALLLLLAIAGGPIVFALLVMASPLILMLVFGWRAIFFGGAGPSHAEHRHRAVRGGGGVKADKA